MRAGLPGQASMLHSRARLTPGIVKTLSCTLQQPGETQESE
jgi:hypothetical protein